MGTSKPKLYKEIAEENLQMIVEKVLGRDAKLVSWESNYFTKIGENFLGKVKGIICKVSIKGQSQDLRFVVKLNPRRPLELFHVMTQSFFVKEGRYLNEVVPKLNIILRAASKLPLSVPECPFVNYTPQEEVILLKDLREENFKMFNKMNTMDINHLLLVVDELAKQHSSSYVHHLQSGKKRLNDMFPYMVDLWLDANNPGSGQYIKYCKMRISSTIKALEELQTHPEALSWLKQNEDILFDVFVQEWEKSDPKFQVICHGDCWTNNMLFKYDEENDILPTKVTLLDFQQCKIGSLTTDLHILFTTTTSGDNLKKYNDRLLRTYYKTFDEVCLGSGRYTPFSFDELKREFSDKAVFGFVSGIMRLPLLLQDDEPEALDFNKMDAETYLQFIKDQDDQLISMLSMNKTFKERYNSVFKTATEYGVFRRKLQV